MFKYMLLTPTPVRSSGRPPWVHSQPTFCTALRLCSMAAFISAYHHTMTVRLSGGDLPSSTPPQEGYKTSSTPFPPAVPEQASGPPRPSMLLHKKSTSQPAIQESVHQLSQWDRH